MKTGKPFPWIAASLVAGAALTSIVWLVNWHAPTVALQPRPGGKPVAGVAFTPAADATPTSASLASLSLQNPTPLFLPTIYNSGRVEPTMTAERSPGISFGKIEAKTVFSEEDNRLSVPDVIRVQPQALAVIESLAPDISLRELARSDGTLVQLPARLGIIEVQDVRSGRTVLRQEISGESTLAAPLAPMDLMVAVDRAGLMTLRGALDVVAGGGGLPLLGQQQPDLEALQELLRSTQFAARLSAGIYRISLGP